ncbi:MAG TPA: SDR family NAD(P)-dependent oxidoreductase, partial [Granulicella sp.]
MPVECRNDCVYESSRLRSFAIQPIFGVTDQVALITGGGSGIGRATAKLLATCGAHIAVTELPGRKALLDSLLMELEGLGVRAIALTLDLRETLTIENTLRQVHKHFGKLDILVNNAGVQLIKPALDIEETEYDEILTVNLKGPFLCS